MAERQLVLPPVAIWSTKIPQHGLFSNNTVFDPDAIKAMTSAYDHLCVALHLDEHRDPLIEIVAKKIVEHAQRGERNAIALSALVLEDLRSSHGH